VVINLLFYILIIELPIFLHSVFLYSYKTVIIQIKQFILFNVSSVFTMYFAARPEALNPYVRIALYMNFTDAQSYCRQHYTDLATARDQTEDAVIGSYQSSNHLYIGLYRTSTLTWADGNNSTFSFWGAGHPHLYQGAPYCTSTSISDSGRWTDQLCTDTLPFVCHTGE
uniref:C-type lectin domain-containing protein n=1 Tax=Astyanax mexicanus TaxID=7994 RepID=A0A8B9GRE8_ASTMX